MMFRLVHGALTESKRSIIHIERIEGIFALLVQTFTSSQRTVKGETLPCNRQFKRTRIMQSNYFSRGLKAEALQPDKAAHCRKSSYIMHCASRVLGSEFPSRFMDDQQRLPIRRRCWHPRCPV